MASWSQGQVDLTLTRLSLAVRKAEREKSDGSFCRDTVPRGPGRGFAGTPPTACIQSGTIDPKASACMLGPQDVVVARTGAPVYS